MCTLSALFPRRASQAEEALTDARAELERLQGKRQKASAEKTRPPNFEKYSGYTPEAWLTTTGEIMKARAIVPTYPLALNLELSHKG